MAALVARERVIFAGRARASRGHDVLGKSTPGALTDNRNMCRIAQFVRFPL